MYSCWNNINIMKIGKGLYCTAQDNQFKYWQDYSDPCCKKSSNISIDSYGETLCDLCSVTLCNFLLETQLSYKSRSTCACYPDAYIVTIMKYWYYVKEYIPELQTVHSSLLKISLTSCTISINRSL
jgi:hypothetical protein